MTGQEAFLNIDNAIQDFKQREGLYKGIKVSTRPPSDWLSFNWRQLRWTENDIQYLIEVYPNFNYLELITDWNVYVAAYYDENQKRFYLSHKVAEHVTLEFIASHAYTLLQTCSKYLYSIQKADIPVGRE